MEEIKEAYLNIPTCKVINESNLDLSSHVLIKFINDIGIYVEISDLIKWDICTYEENDKKFQDYVNYIKNFPQPELLKQYFDVVNKFTKRYPYSGLKSDYNHGYEYILSYNIDETNNNIMIEFADFYVSMDYSEFIKTGNKKYDLWEFYVDGISY